MRDFDVIGMLALLLGSAVVSYCYASLEPVILFVGASIVGVLFLRIVLKDSRDERSMFFLMFSVGCLMTGVSEIYSVKLGDELQLYSDPGFFHDLSSSGSKGLAIGDIARFTEASLYVVAWRTVYELVEVLGMQGESYVGKMVNAVFVSLSGVIAIRCVRYMYPGDIGRIRQTTRLFALCGMFWLYCGIHVRDAGVLFLIIIIYWCWIRFLCNSSFENQVYLGCSFLTIIPFSYLRHEFAFVPVASGVAGIAALISGRSKQGRNEFVVCFAGLVLAIGLGFSFYGLGDKMSSIVRGENQSYSEHSENTNRDGSLGVKYIVNAPLPVRAIAGSIYILVSPIPVIKGLQLESCYHLFKTANGIYMYFLLGCVIFNISSIIKQRSLRSSAVMFLLYSTIGFVMLVALTSMENRHSGCFLPGAILLSQAVDMGSVRNRRSCSRYVSMVWAGMFGVHVVWGIIRF